MVNAWLEKLKAEVAQVTADQCIELEALVRQVTARQEGRLGLERVNGHHERLKTFINRELRGVSTKYLSNYFGWARAMRRPGFSPPDLLQQAVAA